MSTAQPAVISRDVGRQGKGFRLQKIRAAKFIISSLSNAQAVQAYAAVEYREDVYCVTATEHATATDLEQDKNYDQSNTFTLASSEFLKAMVNFIDCWVEEDQSPKVSFGFYSNCEAGKEINAGRVKDLQIKLPKQPMLELLQKRAYQEPHFLPAAKKLIVAEYTDQYQAKIIKGNLPLIEVWDDQTWTTFFDRINILLGSEDDEQAEKSALAQIRASPYFSSRHIGKEELILSHVIDLFDKKQRAADTVERFVHRAEVELTFLKAAAGEIKRSDPTWDQWEKLAPADGRNLQGKIQAAHPNASKHLIDSLARKAAASLAEQIAHEQDKNLRALKFHAFDECTDLIPELVLTKFQSDSDIKQRIDLLTQAATKRIATRAKDYSYPIANDDSIRGIVLWLFDSCFLSFDSNTTT
ncbi:hypothetical protein [Stigmatella hybrida]|uniref:hypothetical protein n=1 Tax=Stigmatella hybrida TaxID=394097 RepID=UPI001CDA9A4F|nr:hypothetical protein [Stigmatella hybrida]